MKRIYIKGLVLNVLAMTLSVFVVAQLPNTTKELISLKKPNHSPFTRYVPDYQPGQYKRYNQAQAAVHGKVTESSGHFLNKTMNTTVMTALAPNESVIGRTWYDLQSNGAMQNRICLFEDATLGAAWTMGFTSPDFPDRGTGYNYYDGGSWGPDPATRIENTKTGWPSLAQYGPEGEIIVSHNMNTGLEISKRSTKGSGPWTQSLFQGPAACPELSWPRVITNGQGYQQIHLVAVTSPVANGGSIYNGMDGALVYSRSLDGGMTWTIKNVQLPGTTFDNYLGLAGDTYCWAEPRGDTLALLVGDQWFDVFLMKSTDNGQNWTKTIIFQHPYPKYHPNHTMIIDTIWVCDATMAVQLDNDGLANVFFGLMRVNNTDTTDDEYSYWPYTDGLVYWKEGDEPFVTLNADSVYNRGNLVGWCQDLNGNDTIFEEMLDMPKYALSMTGMPTACIDESGDIYLLMSSEMENHDNGLQNYRHILARKWDHAMGEWSDFFDLNANLIHNFHECIFPAMTSRSNGSIHFIYQADENPGFSVRGDNDPYGDNYIYYSKVAKSDFVGIGEQVPLINTVSQNYPNPCRIITSFVVGLNKSARVKIRVTDLMGKLIQQLDKGTKGQGNHSIDLDINAIRPGIYFYTVIADNESVTRKMIIY